MEYIADYTIFNVISTRDVLIENISTFLGLGKSKDFDTGYIKGVYLVTSDELDISNLKMTARINCKFWSEAKTSDMYWTFPQIIE